MLYLVATPIGNPDDITLRALHVLQSVAIIACEDSRKSGRLLAHHGIKAHMQTCHEHNEAQVVPKLIAALQSGEDIALVSDAGMPAISDPGFRLIAEAIKADIPMTSLPGANAVLPALQLSGLAVHSFTFRGFPPRKSGKRQQFLRQDKDSDATLIYYESPYRMAALVGDALQVFGERPCAFARELTKTHEQIIRTSLQALCDNLQNKKRPLGECVLLIGVGE